MASWIKKTGMLLPTRSHTPSSYRTSREAAYVARRICRAARSWILDGPDAIIAADIGGANLRVGIVELKIKKGDITKAGIWKSSLWHHKEDGDPTRDDAVAHMAAMIEEPVRSHRKKKLRLAPFVAVELSRPDYPRPRYHREGAQNLPGDWEEHDFSLSTSFARRLPLINGHEPLFVIHNDAVVQGRERGQTCRTSTIGASLPSAPASATRASPTGSDRRHPLQNARAMHFCSGSVRSRTVEILLRLLPADGVSSAVRLIAGAALPLLQRAPLGVRA